MIEEKKHRLSRDFYKGKKYIAFTLCLKEKVQAFSDPSIVSVFTDILVTIITRSNCIIPVYCFMPDHQHIIITGTHDDSDLWQTIVRYKQKTGFWLSKNQPAVKWQKDFYDHILKTEKEVARQVRYILDNPVRKGLAESWEEYPFKGSIRCSLHDVLTGIM